MKGLVITSRPAQAASVPRFYRAKHLVAWSEMSKRVVLVELTVPWEDAVQEASRYADLVAECQRKGCRATTYPVEIGCRGFVAQSTSCFLRDIGFSSGEVRKAVRDLAEEAEKGGFWLRRYDKSWGAEKPQGIMT